MRTGTLAKTLAGLGYDVTWFGSRFEHGRKTFLKGQTVVDIADNYRVVLLDGPGYKKNVSLRRIRHQQKLGEHFQQLAPTLVLPDVILATYPAPELCAAVCEFARATQVPYLVDARDPWPDSFAEYFPRPLRFLLSPLIGRYRKILTNCVQGADSVVSMSNEMLNWALSFSGHEKRPQDRVFYLGYERPKTRPRIAKEEFSAEHPLVAVFVGMFGMSYDGPTVIKAMRILAEAGEKNIRLVMVGSGNYESEWKKLATNLPNVTFAGWQAADGIAEMLRTSHVGLVPLRGGITKFWMGNKLFEYASQGLAVINTATGEPARVLREGQFGVTVPVGDSAAVADALRNYIANPDFLYAQRKASREQFEKRFDSEKVYREFAEHVLSFAAGEPGREVANQGS